MRIGNKEFKFSRFDVILAFILTFAVSLIAADMWLVMNGYGEFSSPVFTFAGTITGGEIVAFSIYQIAKEVTENTPKTLRGKHSYINDLEEENDGKTE